MGLLITIIVTSCGKIIAGRLRPHFIDVCKPNFTAFDCTDEMGHPIYVNNYACFGDPGKIHDARYVLFFCPILSYASNCFQHGDFRLSKLIYYYYKFPIIHQKGHSLN